MRDDRIVYQKTLRRTLGQWDEGTAEMAAVVGLPCAPAIGVHRPHCGCSEPVKEEK